MTQTLTREVFPIEDTASAPLARKASANDPFGITAAPVATAATTKGADPASRGQIHRSTLQPLREADLALIRRIGGYMPPPRILSILNERLLSDLGPDEDTFTLEQVKAAIAAAHGQDDLASQGRDWPSLRKLLAGARRAGTLDRVDETVIADFAVAFQLTAKQVVELKDIVLGAKEE